MKRKLIAENQEKQSDNKPADVAKRRIAKGCKSDQDASDERYHDRRKNYSME